MENDERLKDKEMFIKDFFLSLILRARHYLENKTIMLEQRFKYHLDEDKKRKIVL